MKLYQANNLIEWLKNLLLQFEQLFHGIQRWLMGEDKDFTWPGRIIVTDSDAAKEYEKNHPTTAAAVENE